MKKILLSILSIISIASQAQVKKDSIAIKFSKTITAADLEEHLTILASDEYEGRETGKKGQKLAAEYISKHFEEYGLTPVDEGQNYYQEMELLERSLKSSSLKNNNATGKLFKQFYFYGLNKLDIKDASLVFGGYGIESDNYSNYKGLDIKGKVVLLLEGEPLSKDGNSLISKTFMMSEWGMTNEKKVALAYQKGAKAVIIISTGSEEGFLRNIKHFKHYYEKPSLTQIDAETPPTTIYTTTLFASKLLNVSEKKLSKFESKLSNDENAHSKIEVSNITIQLEVEEKKMPTENVLGLVNGTDKADEIIVITAHYDHIGIKGDNIYNGADDDGSGTVAVMEMAQAFAEAKKAGYGPRRSLLFMAVTGEEKGLLGSEYYSNNPIFPIDKTITNLNIDMIGRIDEEHAGNKNYIYLIGTNMLSNELHDISEETNKTYKNIELDYTYNSENDPNQFYYRSDHYNFAKHNVPVIFYFNGVHEDYHKSTDTVDKILFDKVENITQLIYFTAWELANRDERPKVDKTGATH